MTDWLEIAHEREQRYRDREALLGQAEDADTRQRQLTQVGNAAGAAGLAYLMAGRPEAAEWFHRAVERYRQSWPDAPPGSWGRPIGAIKNLLLAEDWQAAEQAARWPLEAGAATVESPIGRYAATLALLVLDRDAEARHVAAGLRGRDDFPPAVADALVTIAAGDGDGYRTAVEEVLESFETRDGFLEEMRVADTVIVLQALAVRRGIAAGLRESELLPSSDQPASSASRRRPDR